MKMRWWENGWGLGFGFDNWTCYDPKTETSKRVRSGKVYIFKVIITW